MHTALLPKHHELSGEASKPVDDNVEQVDVRQLIPLSFLSGQLTCLFVQRESSVSLC